jgi:acetyl-CoA carboxylase biotin carboxyl carrier protein
MLSDKEITYTLTFHDVIEILRLVRESAACTEMQFQIGDLTLKVAKAGPAAAPSREKSIARENPSAQRIEAAAVPDGLVKITAPVLGVFYRAPAPGAAPFVSVGDTVRESDTIGLIEVMKLFTSVTAGTAGRVVEILAENAALVEYGQALVLIEPS